MKKDLIVVIPTNGRPDLLRRTLASLAECEKPNTYREMIIVENGVKKGAEEIVRSFGSLLETRYLHVSEGNKSIALNNVLHTLDDELIVFFDDDVRVHRDVLCAYAEAAEGMHGGKFFGGPTDVDYQKEPQDWIKGFLPASARGFTLGNDVRIIDKPLFLGFNWAAFAGDIKKCGGFNQLYGPGAKTGSTGQETEMQRRLIAKGILGLYVPKALAWHYVPADSCTAKWVLRRHYREGISSGLDYTDKVPTILGYPRWTLRSWFENGIEALIKSFHKDKSLRFSAYCKLAHHSGFMRGFKTLIKNSHSNWVK